VTAPEGVLSALVGKFETSPEFEGLAPRTQDDYRKQFKLIYRNFGDLPLEALCDPRCAASSKICATKLPSGRCAKPTLHG
jgi:hypothetical protein